MSLKYLMSKLYFLVLLLPILYSFTASSLIAREEREDFNRTENFNRNTNVNHTENFNRAPNEAFKGNELHPNAVTPVNRGAAEAGAYGRGVENGANNANEGQQPIIIAPESLNPPQTNAPQYSNPD